MSKKTPEEKIVILEIAQAAQEDTFCSWYRAIRLAIEAWDNFTETLEEALIRHNTQGLHDKVNTIVRLVF